jgi:hypothetical protein
MAGIQVNHSKNKKAAVRPVEMPLKVAALAVVKVRDKHRAAGLDVGARANTIEVKAAHKG